MLVVAAGVIVRAGRVMICQRKQGVHNALKWEFPGGKLEAGESPEEALRRELREELEIDVQVGRVLDAVRHGYGDRDVLILFYACEILSGEPRAVDCNAVVWAAPEALPGYDFADGDRRFLARSELGSSRWPCRPPWPF